MRLSEYASTQRTYGSRKVPRSVQQSIPIDRIYEDGTWRCGNVYSQMWSMPDINFTMSDEDNKAKILNLLGKVYMGVPSDCWLKICIVSQRMDEKSLRENVLLHRNLDGLDKWRVERNRRIRQYHPAERIATISLVVITKSQLPQNTCIIQGRDRRLWFEDGRWFVAAKVVKEKSPQQ